LGLNETALAIWDLCDGSTTVAEMVVAVVELTGIDADQVTADVVRVVDEYTRLGIVTIRN
jgi:pyrroloquinoline quinone biosynthesis protein D